MAVEVLACAVVAHGGAWIDVTCCYLNVAEVHAGVEHRGGPDFKGNICPASRNHERAGSGCRRAADDRSPATGSDTGLLRER
jgi:hypothetical protein